MHFPYIIETLNYLFYAKMCFYDNLLTKKRLLRENSTLRQSHQHKHLHNRIRIWDWLKVVKLIILTVLLHKWNPQSSVNIDYMYLKRGSKCVAHLTLNRSVVSFNPVVSLGKRLYHHCLVLVGSGNGFKRNFAIKLIIEGLMEDGNFYIPVMKGCKSFFKLYHLWPFNYWDVDLCEISSRGKYRQ